jgi:hypothetical protein
MSKAAGEKTLPVEFDTRGVKGSARVKGSGGALAEAA